PAHVGPGQERERGPPGGGGAIQLRPPRRGRGPDRRGGGAATRADARDAGRDAQAHRRGAVGGRRPAGRRAGGAGPASVRTSGTTSTSRASWGDDAGRTGRLC